MAQANLVISPFDPEGALSNPQRALCGIVDSGSVTPGTAFGVYARWLYVGVAGNVVVQKWNGETQAYANLAAGVYHPICAMNIVAAGTTATNMVWGI